MTTTQPDGAYCYCGHPKTRAQEDPSPERDQILERLEAIRTSRMTIAAKMGQLLQEESALKEQLAQLHRSEPDPNLN
jgi:uncharacterized coiled-coil DUF342 family protein